MNAAPPIPAPTDTAPPRTVLVTGGNRGIGLAIAREFLDAGHRVVVASRDGTGPEGAHAVACDVTSTESVDAAFDAAEDLVGGPIDIVVANAGITRDTLLMRMSDTDFQDVVDTNLAGAFRCSRRASKGMLQGRYGRFVFVSSVMGLYGSPGQANYASAKAGLVGLARSITRELGKRNITANVVAPGFIETEMTRSLSKSQRETYLAATPAGRFAQPEEVARVVRFLAGENAAYISGAVIPVDGGLGMGH
ncbi:3-oxoacyl-ACP reductase FabG [Nocardia takedensis]|uniref:3-oxoacyl-ACP reductase FabG n=1 Tax=Nocardia takedensis TaxID=259390 RepID=UPI00030B00E0|nr:3-oxoacyl-ACP reductase FabG [Nocardia takedensis]